MRGMNFNPDHIHMFSDTVHSVHVPHRNRTLSKRPATVISEPRPSWLDNDAAWIRHAVCELVCGEKANVNGHRIERTDAFSRVSFHVNGETTAKGTLKRFSLEETIAKVST